MSKGLSRVRALITEIDLIQTQGRKTASGEPPQVQVPTFQTPEYPQKAPETAKVIPIQSKESEAPVSSVPEAKVFIQLTGKIVVQLQLEHTEEIVEVSQKGESIEIRFDDGKAIHLPLRSVA